MGSCFSCCQRDNQQNNNELNMASSSGDSFNLSMHQQLDMNSSSAYVPTGHNKRLKKEKIKWKADVAISEQELQGKRDEFWETSPVFEGRIEIWDAIKAAVNAMETNNHTLAQAIIDSAQISLPNGTLSDCYDELGNRYQIPNYVLAKPTNLKQRKNSSESKTEKNLAPQTTTVNTHSQDKHDDQAEQVQTFQLKFRLSNTNEDIKLKVDTNQTVESIKQQIAQLKSIDPVDQRMFYGGKLLEDKQKIKVFKLRKNFVVQVFVRESDVK